MSFHIQIQPEAKAFLEEHEHMILTISADRECAGANCSESFTHPRISFTLPDKDRETNYDLFNVDGVTVFFEKSLEIDADVTIVKEHHLFRDDLRVEGLPKGPEFTRFKL